MDQQVCARKNKKGYVILYAVIILTAVVLAVVTYSAGLAMFSARSSADLRKSSQAEFLADTCAETALQKIWDDNNYTGSGNQNSLFGGSCSYQVTNTGGSNREIRSTGIYGNMTKKVKISAVISGGLVSASPWREVADF